MTFKKQIHLDPAEVKRLYIDKKWTIEKVAAHLRISQMSVHRFMVKVNIPRRGSSLGDSRTLTKDLLKELYVDKHLSQEQIASILRLSPGTISNKMRDFQIPARNSAHPKLDSLEIGESYIASLENKPKPGLSKFYDAARWRGIQVSLKTIGKDRIRVTRVK
jgi:transcriptional regulator with XRE-family HTH domain